MKIFIHKCLNCSRDCSYKEQNLCSFCAIAKETCGVCGKTTRLKNAVEQIHPFFGLSSGCKSCH